ncbi:MAG: superoxide dismutase family protein, partial [Candidatus Omnitrophica bacterium]|nr:superoxide dismutase family protein [Candidatus Omnitrophota bacterium]
FKSAGGHFNPEGREHGKKNPKGAHAGDLPNLVVGPEGELETEVLATGVNLGNGPRGLLKPQGTSLVIHANPDDETTDPAGSAGARVACGAVTP